jgi:hypothetical protein
MNLPVLHQALKCHGPLCKFNVHEFFIYAYTYNGGQDNVVSIVTCFGLDSLGFKSHWKKEIYLLLTGLDQPSAHMESYSTSTTALSLDELRSIMAVNVLMYK